MSEFDELMQGMEDIYARAKKQYDVNFGDEKVPASNYVLKLDSIRLIKTSAGNPRIMRNWIITEGLYEGYPIVDGMNLNNETGISFWMRDIAIMGYAVPSNPEGMVKLLEELNATNPIVSATLAYNGQYANLTIKEAVSGQEGIVEEKIDYESELGALCLAFGIKLPRNPKLNDMINSIEKAGGFSSDDLGEAEFSLLENMNLDSLIDMKKEEEEKAEKEEEKKEDKKEKKEKEEKKKEEKPEEKKKASKKEKIAEQQEKLKMTDERFKELTDFCDVWGINIGKTDTPENVLEAIKSTEYPKNSCDENDIAVLKSLNLEHLMVDED